MFGRKRYFDQFPELSGFVRVLAKVIASTRKQRGVDFGMAWRQDLCAITSLSRNSAQWQHSGLGFGQKKGLQRLQMD
jgi:hypothetical protein